MVPGAPRVVRAYRGMEPVTLDHIAQCGLVLMFVALVIFCGWWITRPPEGPEDEDGPRVVPTPDYEDHI